MSISKLSPEWNLGIKNEALFCEWLLEVGSVSNTEILKITRTNTGKRYKFSDLRGVDVIVRFRGTDTETFLGLFQVKSSKCGVYNFKRKNVSDLYAHIHVVDMSRNQKEVIDDVVNYLNQIIFLRIRLKYVLDILNRSSRGGNDFERKRNIEYRQKKRAQVKK